MRVLGLFLPVVLCVVCVSVLQSDTIHVPGEQPTIQAGIDAAVDGDTVMVADGTYTGVGNRDIDFLGKAIVVTSTNGPDVTIIDAEGLGRVFLIQNEEDEFSVLDGFTITGGSVSEYGGGIYMYDARPTITHCIITGNSASSGGGIWASYCSPTITDCTIADNVAEYYGGGMYTINGSAQISYCLIEGNTATWSSGGGICVGYYGGFTGPRIWNCTFKDNSAYDNGGGLYYFDIAPAYQYAYVWGCIFQGNSAYHGSGACFYDSKISIYNCLFEGNGSDTGGSRGGGIFLDYCDDVLIHNNTLTNNFVESYGGAIRNYVSNTAILNCIIYGNDGVGQISHTYYHEPTVTYSDVEGGWTGTGNIDVDPQFADDIVFHLEEDSPCVDAGDPAILDGSRPPGLGGDRSDMGTYGGSENGELLEGIFDLFLYPTGPTTVYVGESIFFQALFWNCTDNQVTGDYWLSALLPNQIEILLPEFVLTWPNPLHGTTSAHSTTTLNNEIRALFPGTFQVIARVGVYPNLVFDEESFEVVILP